MRRLPRAWLALMMTRESGRSHRALRGSGAAVTLDAGWRSRHRRGADALRLLLGQRPHPPAVDAGVGVLAGADREDRDEEQGEPAAPADYPVRGRHAADFANVVKGGQN